MQEELVTVSTACDHQVNVLQSAKTRLEQDVSGSNVVEEENHRLRARFEELLLKMEADGQNEDGFLELQLRFSLKAVSAGVGEDWSFALRPRQGFER